MRDVTAQLASYQDHLDSMYPPVTQEEIREAGRPTTQVVAPPLRRRLIAFAATFAAIVVLGVIGLLLGGDESTGPADTGGPRPTVPSPDPTIPPSTSVTPTTAGAGAEPERVLFIGNSISMWNDGVDNAIRRLAVSADPPHIIETDALVRLSESASALYRDMLASSLEALWSTGAREIIADGGWDVVVLQEDLGTPTNDVATFHEYVRTFDTEIRAAGARTVLFMHYGYEEFGLERISTEEVTQAHRDIAEELGLDVAPVGLAWQLAATERPDLDLYDKGTHNPSFHGTYLAANVVYATIFGESLESPTYLLPDMSEEEGTFLQGIAQQAVQEYTAP